MSNLSLHFGTKETILWTAGAVTRSLSQRAREIEWKTWKMDQHNTSWMKCQKPLVFIWKEMYCALMFLLWESRSIETTLISRSRKISMAEVKVDRSIDRWNERTSKKGVDELQWFWSADFKSVGDWMPSGSIPPSARLKTAFARWYRLCLFCLKFGLVFCFCFCFFTQFK